MITQLWQLAIIRFYHGFATAIFTPVAMAVVSDLFHRERGEKMGWFSASTLLGRFMAPIVGGSIIGALFFNPGLGYRVVYLICGVAGITALLFAFRIPNHDGGKDPIRGWKETLSAFKRVISSREILITAAVEAAILFAYGTFETFLPLYSVTVGLSAYEIGVFLSAQVITLALTKPIMGIFSDRHGRRPQIFAGAITGAICIGSFPLFKSFIPLLALSILFGLSLSIVTSATAVFIADLSRKETHGSAMGVLGSIMDMGHTTGPLVSGFVAADFGFGWSFLGASLVLVVIAGLFLGVVRARGSNFVNG
jgi:MFS family permease